MNASTCAQCGGTLERQTITHTQPWGDELYEFEHVPAWFAGNAGKSGWKPKSAS